MFLRRTAAVSLSGYLFFGSSVDIGSKAVQVGHPAVKSAVLRANRSLAGDAVVTRIRTPA